jgi:predicted transcriptional regulator
MTTRVPISERRARDLMSGDPICATPHMSVRDLVVLLDGAGVSGAPVVDRQGAIVGVVSKSDLLHACLSRSDDYEPAYLYELIRGDEQDDVGPASAFPDPEIHVEDFMSDEPITAPPSAPVSRVARMMIESKVHRVIIVDRERVPVGVVTSLDIVRLVAESEDAPR